MQIVKMSLLVSLIVAMMAPASFAEPKLATVDVDRLFDEYQNTIKLNEDMEDEIKAKQTERDSFVEEIRKLKDELVLLADANKKEKQEEIDQLIQELQLFDEQTRQELAEKRNEFMREILVELDDKVKDYGKSKGFDYIFNTKLLLYSKEKYDVTDDLLKQVNK